MGDALILDAVRCAVGRGRNGGALRPVHPVDLLAQVLAALLDRTGVPGGAIDDVIAGCVQQGREQATNIGHAAALAAGLPPTVPGTTVNRQCGSSQQAAHFAAQGVMAGAYDVVIACGVESMSRVPIGTAPQDADDQGPRLRARMAPGLVNQGIAAELVASRWGLTRADLDGFAALSHERASQARDAGLFSSQLVPIEVPGTARPHMQDETIRDRTTAAVLADLPPAFRDDAAADARFPEIQWHVTAGNSSPLTDGASAVLIASPAAAARLGLEPRARFCAFDVIGDDPLLMLTAPIPATRRVLQRAELTLDDIDAFEINEAFASVPLAWARELDVDLDRVNPWGGAIALGHALGSSGTRLLGTLVAHLEHVGGRYGLQTMCEAGGLANATVIERL